MLWRVRTTLHDRPGSLAELASSCGRAGVNILGLQIFPALDRVTDELVLRTPDGWDGDRLTTLLEASGGTGVTTLPCTEAALGDQPTRYVTAARRILAEPATFPEVAARLFDAEPEHGDGDQQGAGAGSTHVMELQVVDVSVQLRRGAAFTGTELARGAALADLVTVVLEMRHSGSHEPGPRHDVVTEYVVAVGTVTATVAGTVVGEASWHRAADRPESRLLRLSVEPAWRRRGIGAGLLREAIRAAVTQRAEELVVRTTADNSAVLPLVLGTGLRGRIRLSADELTVRIPIRQLAGARRGPTGS